MDIFHITGPYRDAVDGGERLRRQRLAVRARGEINPDRSAASRLEKFISAKANRAAFGDQRHKGSGNAAG